jgi:hypothetical protein
MSAADGQPRPYFVSPAVDFALLGGVSLAIFAVFSLYPIGSDNLRLVAAGALTIALNWPHFAATSFRLYGSTANRRQYPVTALIAPILSIGAVAGALASPLLVAPLFLKIFLVWSPFHYSGQTMGITLIYARRNGLDLGRLTRMSLAGFVYLSFLSQSAASEVSPVGKLYSGVRLPNFGIPAWMPPILHQLMIGFGAVALTLLVIDCARKRRAPPLMLLLPAAAQYIWFVPGSNVPFYREFVPAFHSLQYLLIAWSMHLHESVSTDGGARLTPSRVVSRSATWIAVNVAGGALLFWVLPQAVAAGAASPPAVTAGIVAAGVQVHHFFVDGVIWKLKRRTVSSPLMMSVIDLFERPSRPAPVAAPEPAL